MSSLLLSVEEAIEEMRQGRQIILVDDEDRENEGDLCMAAVKATADDINFMAKHGRGLICLTMTRERIEALGLPKMSQRNESRFGTNFHVSIEAREGVTTGISASDRAKTIAAAVAPDALPQNLVSPGHVFPIAARTGGVLVRSGQTEGSVDLARLAGLEPAGVICEIMKDDGTMARRPDLEVFAKEHGLGIVSIAQLIEYRLQRESQIVQGSQTKMPPLELQSEFDLTVYKSGVSAVQYLVLSLGDISTDEPVLVRVHRAVIPTDVFGNQGGRSKNLRALELIEKEGRGVFVYVLPEGLDLSQQLSRMAEKQQGIAPSLVPELREFGLGAQVLATLGLKEIRLMTDNEKRIVGLDGYGLKVVERVPLNNRS